MSKFKVGDKVRIINVNLVRFDRVGEVFEIDNNAVMPFRVSYSNGETGRYQAHELTLADSEPHAADALNRRAEMLRTAESLVNGARADDYGDPEENFRRIADLWAPIIGSPITPGQVSLCMAQVKIARLITSPTHQDSWIDLAGYAALGAEITERRA